MNATTMPEEKTSGRLKPGRPKAAKMPSRAAVSEETAERVRISFDISTELNERLQTMARDMNGTKSDVLRRSLALMEAALQATKDGKKVGFAERSDQLTTEIVGLRY